MDTNENRLQESLDDCYSRFDKLMPKTNDLILIILKCHLLIEEFVFEYPKIFG